MKTKDLVLMAMFAALTAIGAQIAIPIKPVPFTFQLFFVLLSGALLGSLRGGLSQLVYLGLGVIGLPVFAGGTSGVGVVLGPSGGYLIGFVVAAFIVGAICDVARSFAGTLIAMVLGVFIIYTLGLAQLMLVTQMAFMPALSAGVFPFIPFDLLKAAIAAGLAERLRPVIFASEISPGTS